MEPVVWVISPLSQEMKPADCCLLGWRLVRAERGEALFTGLEVLCHLILGKLSSAKGAGSLGEWPLRGLRFHLSLLPLALQLASERSTAVGSIPRTA